MSGNNFPQEGVMQRQVSVTSSTLLELSSEVTLPTNCLTTYMTKRFLITATILLGLMLGSAESFFAQDSRQPGDNRTTIIREQDSRSVGIHRNVQQLRVELNSLFDETEAALGFLAQYSVVQESAQKTGSEDLAEIVKRVADMRAEIAAYSDSSLLVVSESFPDSATMARLTATLRKMHTSAGYQSSLDRAEKWFLAQKNRSSAADSETANVRSTVSAPAFTRPVCNFYNLVDFASAADTGIAKGVLLAIEIIINSLNPSLGNNAPNPAYYVAVAAKAISKAVVIALDGVRDAGLWCQDMAFNLQGAMMSDGVFIDAILFPPSGGYLEFLKDFMPAIIQKASEQGVTTNCATTFRVQGDGYYNQGKWVDAYKMYRAAYTQIGAAPPTPPNVCATP